MIKKCLAIVLTICMILSVAPSALAAGSQHTDVYTNDWYSEAVEWVYENGLLVGNGDGFSPEGTVTRAMVWVALARATGVAVEGSDPWWLAAQEWAIEAGISDGTMHDKNTTREQLITMLYRYAKLMKYDVAVDENVDISVFTDADTVSVWAVDAMKWACANKLIHGIYGSLEPQSHANRAQLSVVLHRYDQEVKAPAENEPAVHYCSFGNWTPNDDGTHSGSCICGVETAEDCSYGDYAANNDGTHSHACTKCGYIESSACNYGNYTCSNDGTHSQTCADCGYIKTESCSVVIPDAPATPACAHCGFADVIVVDSIANLKTEIKAENEGKTILLKKGTYEHAGDINIIGLSINIIGEKNPDGTLGTTIKQMSTGSTYHSIFINGGTNPAVRKHVSIGGIVIQGNAKSKAGVDSRGNVIVDLYDMVINDAGWNAIAIDLGSDDTNDLRTTVNAYNVQTSGAKARAQVNADPRANASLMDTYNYAEFNFDAACSAVFATNNGFDNVETDNIGYQNIKINGAYYTPSNWILYPDGNVEIYTAAGLKKFAELHGSLSAALNGKTVKLMNDITLTGSIAPIGTAEKPFLGSFDGNGKTISGLTVGGDAATNAGLFGVLGGTVKNLTVTGAEISGTANIGVIAGAVNEGAVITDCNVSDSYVICTDLTAGKTPADCNADKIAGNIPAEFDLSSNTAGNDVIVMMAYNYDAATNTYSVASPAALTLALNTAATVDTKAPVIELVYGKYNSIVIPNNVTGNDPRLVGLTLKGYAKAVVGHLNLNGIDNAVIDSVIFDAGKAGSGLSEQYESIFSGVTASMKHSCVGLVIQNCRFTGTYQTHPYNCIRFPEKTTSSNHTRGTDITIQNCQFLCNAQQYVRLDYVYGDVKILGNTFGGNGFGSSHNNINATNNYADWTITGNSFNNWQYTYDDSVNDGTAYAFGSSRGTDPIAFTFSGNSFNNVSGDVIWLKNYNDATHEGICIENNSYGGGLTKTDADAILRVTG